MAQWRTCTRVECVSETFLCVCVSLSDCSGSSSTCGTWQAACLPAPAAPEQVLSCCWGREQWPTASRRPPTQVCLPRTHTHTLLHCRRVSVREMVLILYLPGWQEVSWWILNPPSHSYFLPATILWSHFKVLVPRLPTIKLFVLLLPEACCQQWEQNNDWLAYSH